MLEDNKKDMTDKQIDISNCPARQGFLPNDALGCHCYYVNEKKGIIDVSAATPYNTTYYAMDKNNCCNGYAKAKPRFPKGYPTNQNGRWNWGTTNTKMYPPNGLMVHNRVPICNNNNTYPGCYSGNYNVTGARQSKNIFPNTHKMSQKKLFAYLSRNRHYLNR